LLLLLGTGCASRYGVDRPQPRAEPLDGSAIVTVRTSYQRFYMIKYAEDPRLTFETMLVEELRKRRVFKEVVTSSDSKVTDLRLDAAIKADGAQHPSDVLMTVHVTITNTRTTEVVDEFSVWANPYLRGRPALTPVCESAVAAIVEELLRGR
jgi:hypothetical protein